MLGILGNKVGMTQLFAEGTEDWEHGLGLCLLNVHLPDGDGLCRS